jgi:hypothetical protein
VKETRTDRPAYRLTVKEGEREEEVSWNDSFEEHAQVRQECCVKQEKNVFVFSNTRSNLVLSLLICW